MKKYLTVMATLALAAIAFAEGNSNPTQLHFSELPFAEGKLFVAVACGDNTILAKAIEVEDGAISIPADLSAYYGKELNVQAFQDLNGNDTLDFDDYGRPTEPCLRTVITPAADQHVIGLTLVQY